ncbi:PREDICTED: uncharacterized protein LOC101309448 [Fragaria vesca subsp. vesca]|uniref:uncharacterized protein LOC101309448 n=1 Tax=Fragaria vesca subsp. vesca TaxID=101020 RepID=UPI0002C3228A|nr:PREDICTED: uncharacterized protein LOC101309448 [Fragaria vesca subsp. vesca]
MAGYFVSEPMQRNMTTRKRKELGQLDQVNDDLSDFSLSSPARKIRRLDAQLPPILEEDEVEFDPAQNYGPMIEELENQERAIVLFNPVNNPMLYNPSNVSISLSPDLVSGFKDQFVRSSYQYGMKCDKSEEEQDSRNQCTAVVPWVPSQLPPMPATEVSQSNDRGEPMEDEEMGAAAMEVEDSSTPAAGAGGTSNGYNGGIWGSNSEGFQQWQQQHCMTPQPPQNTSTPITWFR